MTLTRIKREKWMLKHFLLSFERSYNLSLNSGYVFVNIVQQGFRNHSILVTL